MCRRGGTWDAIVVPESFCVDLYRREYRFTGSALVTGYPRNDNLVTADTAEARSRVLAQLGIAEDRIVVLYAPTWRDTAATSPWTAKLFDGLDLEALAVQLAIAMPCCFGGTTTTCERALAPRRSGVGRIGLSRDQRPLAGRDVAVVTIPPFASTGW
jgi:hypothetical protein